MCHKSDETAEKQQQTLANLLRAGFKQT